MTGIILLRALLRLLRMSYKNVFDGDDDDNGDDDDICNYHK